MRVEFVQYIYNSQNGFAQAMNTIMSELNRTQFQRCDPEIHIENETYLQFINIDQAYVINEVNMNGDTCSGDCEDRRGYRETCKNNYRDFYCTLENRCDSFHACIRQTKFIHVCYSHNQTSNRRYDHIMMTNDSKLKNLSISYLSIYLSINFNFFFSILNGKKLQ